MMFADYIKNFSDHPLKLSGVPWEIVTDLKQKIRELINTLGDDYKIEDEVAIHKDTIIEQNVVLKGPLIISKGCSIAANAYIRDGVFLDENVTIGPGCEIKSTIVFNNSAIAHLNYVGDSIVGSNVNIEGGAVVANHYNEREDKEIAVFVDNELIKTGVTKFGALIVDNSRLGANSVTSPGTILKPGSIVGRLELVKQTDN